MFLLSGADLDAVEVREDVDPVLVVRAGIEAIEHIRREGPECALDAVWPYHAQPLKAWRVLRALGHLAA